MGQKERRWGKKKGVTRVIEGQGGREGGYKMVQLQAEHYFSLLNKRFHGVGQCLAETAECH